MRWPVVFAVIAVSIVISVLVNIFGLLGNVGWWFGILASVVYALIMCLFIEDKFFMNGFWAGAIGGIINALLVWFFYDTYLTHNAAAAEAMAKVPEGMDMRSITLYTSPIGAAIGGVIMGAFTWMFGKLLGRLPEKVKVEPPAPTTTEQTDQTTQS